MVDRAVSVFSLWIFQQVNWSNAAVFLRGFTGLDCDTALKEMKKSNTDMEKRRAPTCWDLLNWPQEEFCGESTPLNLPINLQRFWIRGIWALECLVLYRTKSKRVWVLDLRECM